MDRDQGVPKDQAQMHLVSLVQDQGAHGALAQMNLRVQIGQCLSLDPNTQAVQDRQDQVRNREGTWHYCFGSFGRKLILKN